jgi:PAS domain S-box-containing protein
MPEQFRAFDLSKREREILALAREGMMDKEIAEELGVKEATVKTFWGSLRHKLGARNRTHALSIALRHAYTGGSEDLQRAKHLLDSHVIGVVVKHIGGEIYDANDAFLQMVGYSREDLPGLRWTEITLPEYLPREIQALGEMQEAGEFKPFLKEYRHKSGHRVPILFGGAWLDREHGRMICYAVELPHEVATRLGLST